MERAFWEHGGVQELYRHCGGFKYEIKAKPAGGE
jgi:hypothetical protein